MAATLTILLLLTAMSFALVVLTMTVRESGDKILDALGALDWSQPVRYRRGRFIVSRRRPSVLQVRRAWSAAA